MSASVVPAGDYGHCMAGLTGRFISSIVIAEILKVPHSYVLEWVFDVMPASMRDLAKPGELQGEIEIHESLCPGVLDDLSLDRVLH